MSRARHRYRIVSIVLVVVLGGILALAACANYPEGDRCETLNNNDDCQDGLQCLPKAQVNPGYNNSDRCCPPDRATASHPACTIVQNAVGNDATPPLDTGPPPDGPAVDAADSAVPEAAPADAADEG